MAFFIALYAWHIKISNGIIGVRIRLLSMIGRKQNTLFQIMGVADYIYCKHILPT